jgi:hypothetical protein
MTATYEAELERIAASDSPMGPPILTPLGQEQLRLYPELLKACKEDRKRINELCGMVNRFAARLNLGKKVNAEDWADVADAAITKAEAATRH